MFRNGITFLNAKFYFGDRVPIRFKRYMLKNMDTIEFFKEKFYIKKMWVPKKIGFSFKCFLEHVRMGNMGYLGKGIIEGKKGIGKN